MPKLSIVVPSLNVHKYIRECLDSIINQTCTDIEVICVDAGSTDGTLEILQEYAQKDARIKLIISSKKSYGYQVNLGMDQASGEYVGIVESDDFIETDMYEHLYKTAKENNLDCVKGDHHIVKGEKSDYDKVLIKALSGDNELLYGQILGLNEYDKKFAGYLYTWAGIYKREYIEENRIRHNETPGASYQDNGFWFQTMIYAKRMMFVNFSGYNLRRDNFDSSFFSKEKMHCIRDEYDFIHKIIEEADIDNKQTLLEYCFKFRFYAYTGQERRLNDHNFTIFYKYLWEDTHKALEKNEINLKLFQQKYMMYLVYVLNCDEPLRFISSDFVRTDTMNLMTNSDNIYLYGAGIIGRQIYEKLQEIGLESKVKGFIVTDKSNKTNIDGLQVFQYDEVQVGPDDIIIISVKDAFKQEIEDILRDNYKCKVFYWKTVFW